MALTRLPGFTVDSTSDFTFASVTTTAANLGAVDNLIITGGESDYVLSTDGSGTLSWVPQTGGSGGPVGGTGLSSASVQVFTANGTGNIYTLSVTPVNENQMIINIDGVMQLHSAFNLSGNVITLTGTPVSGAKVEVISITSGLAAGTDTQIQFNDGGNIAGSANLTFDKTTNTFNATNITQNGTPLASTGKAIAMAIVFGG